MASQSSEFTRKLRAAVRAKIEEYGIEVDDELPDYVMILVGNKKDKARMKSDLKLFLGDNTSDFVEWLFGFFQKVKASGSGTAAGSGSQPTPKDKSETIEEAIEEKKKSNVDKVPIETHSQKKSSSKQHHKPRKAELPAEAKAPETRSKADSKELRSSSKYDRNRKEQKQRPADEASKKRTTTKPILRSVVIQPIHPRIRPRSPSPNPMVICSGLAPNDEYFPAAHTHKAIESEEQSKRRVVATGSGSMLFQRAARALIQTDNEPRPTTEKKQLNAPENEDKVEALKEKEIEKPRAEEDTTSMATINEKKQEQHQTRIPRMKERKGPPLVGIGAIFQRAIQQTQNQNEPIKGGIQIQQLQMVSLEKRKRIF